MVKKSQKLKTCVLCQQEKKITEFSINRRGDVDSYCTLCRRAVSRRMYLQFRVGFLTPRSYPVITETDDPERRMELIRRAKRTVQASIERRQMKAWIAEIKQIEARLRLEERTASDDSVSLSDYGLIDEP